MNTRNNKKTAQPKPAPRPKTPRDPFSHLSTDGRNWLTLATDPYHDTTVKVAGMPDKSTSKSVLMPLKQNYQISAPGSYIWDLQLNTFPTCSCSASGFVKYQTNALGGLDAQADAATYHWGSVMGISGPTGTLTWFSPSVGLPVALTSNFCNTYTGTMRIVGGGFEVINTTSELYRSGSATVYRTTFGNTLTNFDNNGYQLSYHMYTGLPNTLATATSLPGSLSWEAAEGCYCPFVLGDDVSLMQPNYYGVAFMEDNLKNDLSPTACLVSGVPGITQSLAMNTNLESTGVYFTGLSPETTFTVNVTYYIELCPSPQSQLASLVTSPSTYDPRAITLYYQIVQGLPPGAMLKDNNAGAWWRKVLQRVALVAEIVGTVSAAVPTPAGRAIAMASHMVAGGSRAVSESIPKNSPNRRRR